MCVVVVDLEVGPFMTPRGSVDVASAAEHHLPGVLSSWCPHGFGIRGCPEHARVYISERKGTRASSNCNHRCRAVRITVVRRVFLIERERQRGTGYRATSPRDGRLIIRHPELLGAD